MEKQTQTLKIVTVVTVVVLFVLLVTLVFQFVKINHLKQTENTLQQQLDQYEQDMLHYSQENSYLESAQFIEDYAREVLGYGLTGETRFR